MRKRIRKLVSLFIVALIIYIGYMAIFNPDELQVVFSNASIKIFKKDIFKEENERINDFEIVDDEKSKNKDYTNSIFYPYYETLNERNKEVYKQIFSSIEKHDSEIKLYPSVKKNEILNIFTSVLNDHPEYYWIDSHFSYTIDAYDNIFSLDLKFKYTKEEINNKNIEIDNIIKPIMDEAKKKKLDYEKEKYVHDELINILEYDESVYEEQDIYSALTSKKAVCAGYVRVFQYIMMKLGIPTYYIEGYAGEDHAWALVELDDGFYNVDITWDDQIDRTIYKYFNVSDELIKNDHERNELSKMIVEANGTHYANRFTTLKKG